MCHSIERSSSFNAVQEWHWTEIRSCGRDGQAEESASLWGHNEFRKMALAVTIKFHWQRAVIAFDGLPFMAG